MNNRKLSFYNQIHYNNISLYAQFFLHLRDNYKISVAMYSCMLLIRLKQYNRVNGKQSNILDRLKKMELIEKLQSDMVADRYNFQLTEGGIQILKLIEDYFHIKYLKAQKSDLVYFDESI